jgi:pimeloyl-ACP methyl ester carboxylesterase
MNLQKRVGIAAICGLLVTSAVSWAEVAKSSDDRRETKVKVLVREGKVAWRDLLVGFADARGYDDPALPGKIPDGQVRVESRWFRLTQYGLRKLTDSDVALTVQQNKSGRELDSPEVLALEWDREALTERRRQVKRDLRQLVLKQARGRIRAEFGLTWNENQLRDSASENPLVIAIHGFNSSPQEVAVLVSEVREAGLPIALFRYPNDQAIDDSASLLARELRRFHVAHPDRKVALVTHSMGGLVARGTLEHPTWLDGSRDAQPQVTHLIMVAPPNHGSQLAHFACAADCLEHWQTSDRPSGIDWFAHSIADGLGEARHDLEPDSVFLQQLNRRSRNPEVKYVIFLGSRGGGPSTLLKQAQRPLESLSERSEWVRILCSKQERQLRDMDEMVAGRGDGVVSVARGRLEGVDDVRVLKFRHDSVISRGASDDSPQVWRQIAQCLTDSHGLVPCDEPDGA